MFLNLINLELYSQSEYRRTSKKLKENKLNHMQKKVAYKACPVEISFNRK